MVNTFVWCMTERTQTALERLATSVAATVIAAALVGVFVLLQQVQKSQSEMSSRIAVMSSKLEQTSESVASQRDRIRELENRIRWTKGDIPRNGR